MDAKSLFEILIYENTDTVLSESKPLATFDRDRPIGPRPRGIAGKTMLAYYRKASRTAQPIDEESGMTIRILERWNLQESQFGRASIHSASRFWNDHKVLLHSATSDGELCKPQHDA